MRLRGVDAPVCAIVVYSEVMFAKVLLIGLKLSKVLISSVLLTFVVTGKCGDRL